MKTNFFTTIITDCLDENARGRQLTRLAFLLGGLPAFVGVQSELEAAGNLVDVLDAGCGNEGVVLVNVAPRNGMQERFLNGTPFGYFWYRKTLVISTLDGLTLSLIKKLDVVRNVSVIDLSATLQRMYTQGMVSREENERGASTQFRSLDVLPHIASFLLTEKKISGRELAMKKIASPPPAIWWVDNFGNCKTTLLQEDTMVEKDHTVALAFGTLPYREHLQDVLDGDGALVCGSSGLGSKRFLEIIVQGGNAARHYGLSTGSTIVL